MQQLKLALIHSKQALEFPFSQKSRPEAFDLKADLVRLTILDF